MATPITKEPQPQNGMYTYRKRENCQIQGSFPISSHHNSSLSRRQSNSRSSYHSINHSCSSS
jgi:hypothetical protein